jgi:hypothetical protein
VALTPKERERIIEEETLRYETRRNLMHQYCSSRPRRWPWVLLGLALVWLLYSHIFCGGMGCGYGSSGCAGHAWGPRAHCPYEAQEEGGAAPGQPVAPAPAKK